jgi:hypothetical protein
VVSEMSIQAPPAVGLSPVALVLSSGGDLFSEDETRRNAFASVMRVHAVYSSRLLELDSRGIHTIDRCRSELQGHHSRASLLAVDLDG